MKTFVTVFFLFALIAFSGCENFDYNVYETNTYDSPVEATTSYNISRLLNQPDKDTLYLALTGDTQRFYDDMRDMVNAVNALPQLDAVLVCGDLINFALARESEWVCEELINFRVPFITVIGNHDCLANGVQMYTDIYGPLNYSFTWNRIRFVIHNTNSLEFNNNGTVPDLTWMEQQLKDSSNFDYTIFVSHVPPDHDDFDPALEADYARIVREAKNTIFVTHGHRHHIAISQPYNDGIWYLNTSSPSNWLFTYVKIYTDEHAVRRFDFEFVPF